MAFCARKGVTCIDVSSWLRLAPEHIGRGSTDERADEYPACEQPMVRKAFRPRNAALAAAQRRQRDRPYSGRGRHAGARQHARTAAQIGSASCRERVCQYVLISVVAVSYKKKNQ